MFTQGTLQPGQLQVLYQRDQGLSGMEEEGLAFGLDRDGDTLILVDPQGHRIDAVTFGSQWTDHSLSRDDDGTWTLGLPTPGAVHQSAPVAELSSLRLNEIMANPLPGEPDWLEWVNGHPNLPLALEGLHLRLNQALVALPPHSFLGPQQVRLMEADGAPSPSTLGVRLPAVGADLELLDVRGQVIDQLTYGLQEEGHSFGRLPHSTGGFQSLGLQASPGQPNYLWQGPQLQLHEVMARHQRGVYPGMEGTPDWIELHNPTNARVDLGGVQIGVDGDRWALPEGAFIEAGAYRVLWLDGEDLVERSGFEGWVLPQALPGQGATLELLHPDGRLLDRLTYGIQLPDQSIGRVGGQWALLSRPTPRQATASAASLDSPERLSLNEWQGGAGADWLELYHPGSQPVALAGLSLTDDLSLAGRSK
ncbi:MAG: lamin tail domain-containing protein, partial [Roseibacillus sp.]|nr:lamin tail domain-containing protein [Roseibacillus sp.]